MDAVSNMRNEKKILTTFSIEPSFKAELERMFDGMGLSWAARVRLALREFQKKQAGKERNGNKD